MTSGSPAAHSTPDGDFGAAGLEPDAFRIKAHGDALGFEYLLNRGRHILVLARNQPRRHSPPRSPRAEAAVHLREFEADIAAADDDQMLRQRVELRESTCWSRWQTRSIPGMSGTSARPPTLMKMLLCGEPVRSHLTSCGETKRAWPR